MAEYRLGDVFYDYIPDDAVEWVNTTGTMCIVPMHGDEEHPIYEVVMNEKLTDEEISEAKAVAERARIIDSLSSMYTETFELSDKIGQLFKVVKLGEVEIMREYVTDPDYDPEAEDGSYLKPYKYVEGMEVIESMWYWLDDKDLPHECIKSGIPSGFDDTEYFDIVV